MTYQIVIGRNACLDIVDMAVGVPAKVDSGAFRSSIHCESIKLVKRDGKNVLEVELLGHPCAPEKYRVTFEDFEKVRVTNSFGHDEERYEIKLKVKLGPKVFTTTFTLAKRNNNLFPILLGRKFLKHRFIVDVSKSGVNRVELKKKFGIKTPIDEEDLEV